MQPKKMSDILRPMFVYVAMFTLIIQGIIALAALGFVTFLASAASASELPVINAAFTPAYVLYGTVIAINFALALLAYKGKSWSRRIIIGLTLLALALSIWNAVNYADASVPLRINDLGDIFATLAIMMIGMSCIVLYAMSRRDVKRHFKPRIVT